MLKIVRTFYFLKNVDQIGLDIRKKKKKELSKINVNTLKKSEHENLGLPFLFHGKVLILYWVNELFYECQQNKICDMYINILIIVSTCENWKHDLSFI